MLDARCIGGTQSVSILQAGGSSFRLDCKDAKKCVKPLFQSCKQVDRHFDQMKLTRMDSALGVSILQAGGSSFRRTSVLPRGDRSRRFNPASRWIVISTATLIV